MESHSKYQNVLASRGSIRARGKVTFIVLAEHDNLKSWCSVRYRFVPPKFIAKGISFNSTILRLAEEAAERNAPRWHRCVRRDESPSIAGVGRSRARLASRHKIERLFESLGKIPLALVLSCSPRTMPINLVESHASPCDVSSVGPAGRRRST